MSTTLPVGCLIIVFSGVFLFFCGKKPNKIGIKDNAKVVNGKTNINKHEIIELDDK